MSSFDDLMNGIPFGSLPQNRRILVEQRVERLELDYAKLKRQVAILTAECAKLKRQLAESETSVMSTESALQVHVACG